MKRGTPSKTGKMRGVAYFALVAEFVLLFPTLRACIPGQSENIEAWVLSFSISSLFALSICTHVARKSERSTRIVLPLIAAAIPLAPLVLILIIFSD